MMNQNNIGNSDFSVGVVEYLDGLPLQFAFYKLLRSLLLAGYCQFKLILETFDLIYVA